MINPSPFQGEVSNVSPMTESRPFLGVARSATRPVYINGKLEPRLILPYSLSYDHRVIDGVAGAEFTRFLGTVLTDIRQILL